jgi:4-hydroxymandelate oxidase
MPALSLRELSREARRWLDPAVYDFFAGGADDEITLRANEAAFRRIGLVPHVLRGEIKRGLEITLLGCRTSMPVLIAPTAFHKLAHPDGERATARAAAAANAIMVASMASTVRIEDIAAAAHETPAARPHLWFQLYIQPDLGFTEAIVRRAEAAGCSTVVVSVDSAVFGRRERDLRNGFTDLPAGMCCENLREITAEGETAQPRQIVFSSELSWRDIEWLRKTTKLKIALKGIMHPDDARMAIKLGADAIFVSNHGGRQLDTVPAAIELLQPIADAVGSGIPLVLDGGIRRGTDVVKALALGATAVAIGRPVIWGLSVAGRDGVLQVLEMLRSELDRALALCGCRSLTEVTPDLVRYQDRSKQC